MIRMKRVLSIFLYLITVGFSLSAQNALVLKDNPYIVLDGGTSATPIYLIVNQTNSNGIITQGSGGNIISENEYNYVKWNIGTSTGTFTIPFTTGALSNPTEQKIPLSVQITTAGSGVGDFLFSTYETDDNNLPWASGVTHMHSATGIVDNKDWVVDRFWILDAENYSTKPSAQLSFGFNDDNTEVGAPNLLSPNNLGAQRFNTSNNHWEGTANGLNGIWGSVTGSPGSRAVSGVNTTGTDFYRVWTLTDYSNPLPLDLIYFNSFCLNGRIRLEWESDIDFDSDFEIQRSLDGHIFTTIATAVSLGNQSQKNIFVDESPYNGNNYYRLKIEKEGSVSYSDVIVEQKCSSNNGIKIFAPIQENDIFIFIENGEVEKYDLFLMDIAGKIIYSTTLQSGKGNTQFRITSPTTAKGIYNVLLIDTKGNRITTKIVL